jgi:hypothetical protein
MAESRGTSRLPGVSTQPDRQGSRFTGPCVFGCYAKKCARASSVSGRLEWNRFGDLPPRRHCGVPGNRCPAHRRTPGGNEAQRKCRNGDGETGHVSPGRVRLLLTSLLDKPGRPGRTLPRPRPSTTPPPPADTSRMTVIGARAVCTAAQANRMADDDSGVCCEVMCCWRCPGRRQAPG